MKQKLWALGLVSVMLAMTGCDLSRSTAQTPAQTPTSSMGVVETSAAKSQTEVQAVGQPPEQVMATPAAELPFQQTAPQLPASDSTGDLTGDSTGTTDRAKSADSELQQDYALTTPLPETGQLTIRSDIRSLDLNRLIAQCPTDSSPYAFAESTNYWVQICSAEYDPWQPKYYIGQAKQGGDELQITSTDPDAARQLVFRNAGYTYVLYRDSRTQPANAYLQVFTPSGKGYAEALLYLYESGPPPQ